MDATNKKTLIIVVDDSKTVRDYVRKTLKSVENYEIETADSGDELFKIIHNNIPDLILLDVILPKMDGFGIAKILQSNKTTKKIPIIFLTSLKNKEEKIRGFSVGGVDYITKPFYPDELLSRVNLHIKIKKQYEKILKLNNKLAVELELASNIQKNIILKQETKYNNIKLCFKYLPYEKIGGDYVEIIEIDKYKSFIFIADITGHGIPAALLTMLLKANLYYLIKQYSKPNVIMSKLNHDLSSNLFPNINPSAIIMLIDFKKMIVNFSNAGHPYIMHYNSKTETVNECKQSNTLLGLDENTQFDEFTFSISNTDRIFLYTDGLMNSNNNYNTQIENILKILLNNQSQSIDDAVNSVISFQQSNTTEKFDDDVTFLGIEIDSDVKKKVFIIDDNEDIIKIVTYMLSPLYEVCSATNGYNAGRLISSFEPDLIILDIMLPGINGVEILRQIRADYKSVNVIALTAYKNIKALEKYGFDYIIQKPFEKEDLLNIVKMSIQ